MVDWSSVLSNRSKVRAVKKFATGGATGSDLTTSFANTEDSAEVRTLLRTYGVVYSRRLARKALKRRGY